MPAFEVTPEQADDVFDLVAERIKGRAVRLKVFCWTKD